MTYKFTNTRVYIFLKDSRTINMSVITSFLTNYIDYPVTDFYKKLVNVLQRFQYFEELVSSTCVFSYIVEPQWVYSDRWTRVGSGGVGERGLTWG